MNCPFPSQNLHLATLFGWKSLMQICNNYFCQTGLLKISLRTELHRQSLWGFQKRLLLTFPSSGLPWSMVGSFLDQCKAKECLWMGSLCLNSACLNGQGFSMASMCIRLIKNLQISTEPKIQVCSVELLQVSV